MPDYTKGQIYIIRNHTDARVYIGSTTQTLAQRMSAHRALAKSRPQFKLYQAFQELGVDRFYVERLEEFPCSDKQALHSREGHFIRAYNSVNNGLNGRIAGRTRSEYQRDRYQNDDAFRTQELERTREYKRDRYQNNDAFRTQLLEKARDQRLKDPEFRERKIQQCRNWWINLTEEQQETRRQLRREQWINRTDEQREMYRTNLKERYQSDPEFRDKKRMATLKYKQSLKLRESPLDPM